MQYVITELKRKTEKPNPVPWGQDMEEVFRFVEMLTSLNPYSKPLPDGIDPSCVLKRKKPVPIK